MKTFALLPPLFAAILVAVLQTGVLGYMIESRASILRNGVDVLLKTRPVDPRDLLRGDYVILSYDVSTVPADKVTGGFPEADGEQRLSVRFEPAADGFSAISEASFSDLAPREGSVVAKTLPFYFFRLDGSNQASFSVEYGIERYYVPEGEGRVLEDARNEGALSVNARVSQSGTMQIRQISLDGKAVYDEPLY